MLEAGGKNNSSFTEEELGGFGRSERDFELEVKIREFDSPDGNIPQSPNTAAKDTKDQREGQKASEYQK